MSYNTNHGTSVLKKHVYYEHSYLYNKWGAFCCKRLQKPKVTNKAQRREKMFPLLRSHNSLVANAFIVD
jgi:hypothetical protein